ncbi:hypothetical protein PM10SUCC1_33240 [Propionigenium maris DSM 9537]|uniref:Methyltransferase domain-containing protein n=1 Tax=Propionigenium maris DSM 9537 TaxID=1123000 RepID=A0A9W6GPH9_9FUSO|nr:class I SAM-dependent methyltransferase [Propionigenium maris]GLI57810.1 hypothetical protein PM10SUCC1_33240 [Propionigenium maris DSM 9537]
MKRNFYESINKHYDNIFPLNEKQVEFVKGEFDNKLSKLIEIGCANGKLTAALSEYNIMGVDLEESFISEARKRYGHIKFEKLNMLNIQSLNEKFDGVIAFGNTLVHLTKKEIISFIKSVYEVLNQDGKLLIQILNYDYILDNEIFTLPIIDNEFITFERSYETRDEFLFHTRLTIKSSDEVIENKIVLTPIRKDILVNYLEKVGFKNINVYSSFSKKAYSYKDLPLVISCTK